MWEDLRALLKQRDQAVAALLAGRGPHSALPLGAFNAGIDVSNLGQATTVCFVYFDLLA